jgi:hypothetical protein
MTWFTDPLIEAQVELSHNVLAIAIDGDFPSGHLRLCTWWGSLTVNGLVFTGAGAMGKVGTATESIQLTAETRTYQLSGVDPAIIPESEIDNCFGRSFVEYLVWLDAENYSVIGFEVNFEGCMDKITRRDGGSTPTIEVSVEHRLAILDKTDGWCYTTEHQAQFFAGDTGFDRVKELESIQVTWGGGPVVAGYPPGPAPKPRYPYPGFR